MFTDLIDQIEHFNNFSTHCVVQVYVTTEIIQFSERKLVDLSVNGLITQLLQPISCFFSAYIQDVVCFVSIYHTNIDHHQMLFASRLSTTPTSIVCLSHQNKS